MRRVRVEIAKALGDRACRRGIRQRNRPGGGQDQEGAQGIKHRKDHGFPLDGLDLSEQILIDS